MARRKGICKSKMSLIGAAPPDQKKAVGQRLNALKDQVTGLHESRKQAMAEQGARPAWTSPSRLRPAIGNRHVLMKVIDELTELFGRMGFSVAAGPEVEDEFHNFVALNIPDSHPARIRWTTSTSRPAGEGTAREDAPEAQATARCARRPAPSRSA